MYTYCTVFFLNRVKTWLTGQPMLQSTILMKIDFLMQITSENLHRIKNKPLREKNKRKQYFHLFGDIEAVCIVIA